MIAWRNTTDDGPPNLLAQQGMQQAFDSGNYRFLSGEISPSLKSSSKVTISGKIASQQSSSDRCFPSQQVGVSKATNPLQMYRYSSSDVFHSDLTAEFHSKNAVNQAFVFYANSARVVFKFRWCGFSKPDVPRIVADSAIGANTNKKSGAASGALLIRLFYLFYIKHRFSLQPSHRTNLLTSCARLK